MATLSSLDRPMAPAHEPTPRGIELFTELLPKIKIELIKLRRHWDKHEPRMFSKAEGVSDGELASFHPSEDLVLIRSGLTSYGTVVFGKLRLPKIPGGYIHVRLHDPPNSGVQDALFHSILTEEVRDGDRIVDYEAILSKDTPLEWFNE